MRIIQLAIFKLLRLEKDPERHQFLMIIFSVIRYGLFKISIFGPIKYLHFITQLLSKEIIKTQPNHIKQPIYLRKNSSDIIVFFQNIFRQEIAYSFNPTPELFIDVGANIGTQSVLMKNLYPEIKVITVEISEINNKILKKNLENYSKVSIEEKPIHYKNCPIKVGHLNDAKNYFWGYTAVEAGKNEPSTLTALTLNDIVKKYKLKKIDVIKIDIEPEQFQYELLSHNNDWLEITEHLFIDIHFEEQIKTIKHGLQGSLKALAEKFSFNHTIKGEFLHLYKNPPA